MNNNVLVIPLAVTPEISAHLKALQHAFSDVCNAISPYAQKNSCWARVPLHHLVYKDMRERFPSMGSQMICNAIYSVSRSYRLVFSHPDSPIDLKKYPNEPLPLLKFFPTAPVYFDRHTLNIKGGIVSLFSLNGRLRFNLAIDPEIERRFKEQKIRDIQLSQMDSNFRLIFTFASVDEVTQDPVHLGDFPGHFVVIHGLVGDPVNEPLERRAS